MFIIKKICLWIFSIFICGFLLILGFCNIVNVSNIANNINSINKSQSTSDFKESTIWQKGVFDPYIDITALPTSPKENFVNLSDYIKYGADKNTMLAFLNQKTGKDIPDACWAGVSPIDPTNPGDATPAAIADSYKFNSLISDYTNLGGSVGIAFGGLAGTYIWQAKQATPQNIANEILRAADYYKTKNVDFDIEGQGAAATDVKSQEKLAGALQIINKANPNKYNFSLTLAVLPSGLTDGKGVVETFKKIMDPNNVSFASFPKINIMTMDYGDALAPDGKNKMDIYAEKALDNTVIFMKNTFTEIKDLPEAYGKMGVTPMIGYNDVQGEVLSIAQYKNLANYCKTKDIFNYSMWSLTRDFASQKEGFVDAHSSGMVGQKPCEFSKTIVMNSNWHDNWYPKDKISEKDLNIIPYLITKKSVIVTWNPISNVIYYNLNFDGSDTEIIGKMAAFSISTPGKFNFSCEAMGIDSSSSNKSNYSGDNSGDNIIDKPILNFKIGNIYKAGDRIYYKAKGENEGKIYDVNYYYAPQSNDESPDKILANNPGPGGQISIDKKYTIDNLMNYGYSTQAITDLKSGNTVPDNNHHTTTSWKDLVNTENTPPAGNGSIILYIIIPILIVFGFLIVIYYLYFKKIKKQK